MAKSRAAKSSAAKPPAEKAPSPVLRFHYIKSSTFRVIHVDGAVGGPTPSGGGISLSFYNERMPIPQQVEYELKAGGQLGEEDKKRRISREGVIRELEVTAILDFQAMRALHAWLGERIGDLTPAQKAGSR